MVTEVQWALMKARIPLEHQLQCLCCFYRAPYCVSKLEPVCVGKKCEGPPFLLSRSWRTLGILCFIPACQWPTIWEKSSFLLCSSPMTDIYRVSVVRAALSSCVQRSFHPWSCQVEGGVFIVLVGAAWLCSLEPSVITCHSDPSSSVGHACLASRNEDKARVRLGGSQVERVQSRMLLNSDCLSHALWMPCLCSSL